MWPLLARRIFGPPEVPERFKRLPVWMMLRPSQLRASAAESALMIPSAAVLRRRHPELKMPVAIVAGSDDRVVNSAHNAERLNRELAHSALRVEAGMGHMVHYARPDEVMAAIDSLQPTRAARAQPTWWRAFLSGKISR
jgi:pimeloyl-ACP methyl ester carboxylesterase